MKTSLCFDDVLIVPNFSAVASRAKVDPTVMFLEECRIPIISSNMDSVTGSAMAHAMADAGATAALHRFQSIEENVKEFQKSPLTTMVSIGLGDAELERAAALLNVGASKFIIDVAHGANIEVVRQTKALRKLIGTKSHIVVGNFATGESIKAFLHELGSKYAIDAIKVGIGGGSACTTRLITGCGLPTLSSIIDCKSVGLPMVADGGIRTSGDLAKALAAGASMVMIGRLLAGAYESAAVTTRAIDGLEYKIFRGSASKESYAVQDKVAPHRTPEGESFLVPPSGPVEFTLQTLEAGLRSAMSYVGASTISEFQERAELVQITNAGVVEGRAHGKE